MYRSVTAFRGGIVSLIYDRTLEVQAGIYDENKALTLMSTDVDRMVMSLQSLCEIWARVIEMVIGIWLLGRQLGWICVAPIVTVLGKSVFLISVYFVLMTLQSQCSSLAKSLARLLQDRQNG